MNKVVIANIMDGTSIIGEVTEYFNPREDEFINLEHPFFITPIGTGVQDLNIGFSDVLIFSDEQLISIPMSRVITTFDAAAGVRDLYSNYKIYNELTRKGTIKKNIEIAATETSRKIKEFLESTTRLN